MASQGDKLLAKIEARQAVVGIIGLGYVGLPLAREFLNAGFGVRGFDVDALKVEQINAGQSYIAHIPAEVLAEHRRTGALEATADFVRLAEPDAILICVPTPIDEHKIPDLGYVVDTEEARRTFLVRRCDEVQVDAGAVGGERVAHGPAGLDDDGSRPEVLAQVVDGRAGLLHPVVEGGVLDVVLGAAHPLEDGLCRIADDGQRRRVPIDDFKQGVGLQVLVPSSYYGAQHFHRALPVIYCCMAGQHITLVRAVHYVKWV